MKTFKKYDFAIQVTLIISFLIASLINKGSTFIIGYFVVGGWQVTSMVAHVLKDWFDKKGTRRYYYNMIVVSIAMMIIIGMLIPSMLMIVLYVLLFAAPFMAFYYAWICYDEVFHKMQRPLYQLK